MVVSRSLAFRPALGRGAAASTDAGIATAATAATDPGGVAAAAPTASTVAGAGTASAAETFVAELRRHPPERPRPIPLTYRPLATAIVGARPVHVSTGSASRRALARVGKRAATTGDTIHLTTPRPSPEIMAHELTHVANPSPLPRFFDDDVRDPEERQAEQVAAIMRRSPVLPRSTAAARGTIQRDPTTTSSPGTVSATSLWESVTSGASQLYDRLVGTPGPSTAVTNLPPVLPAIMPTPEQRSQQPEATTPSIAPASPPDVGRQFDRLLELLEDRIISELERRGGRFRGGF